ncbi:MAG: DUF4298 domain-containing protein [Winogradskyella sp.]
MNTLINRITKMENILDQLTNVVEKSNNTMILLENALKDLELLKKYYESQYMKDVMAEKNNKVPQELKRGVLSEDAIHMLLTDLLDLSNKMEKINEKLR